MQLTLVGADGTAVAPDKVVWATNKGVGFVSQTGHLTPFKARKGFLRAIVEGQMVSADVTVRPGAPAKLALKLDADKADANRATITATITDSNANPIPECQVMLMIMGGKSDMPCGTTNDKGIFTTSIAWDPAATNKRAAAVAGELSSEVVAK